MSHQIDDHFLGLILSERLSDSDWDSFSPTDWELIVHLAGAEGVGPLLYWGLSRAERIKLLPEPLQNFLRAMYFSTRMNNEQIIKELETLTRLFAEAGIPAVALKGICFALTIYPDLGLRPMGDVDMLVPASKASDAVRIARASGYMDATPEAAPGLDRLLNHAVCLKKTSLPFTTLELHTTLIAERSFSHAVPVDWFWEQTEPLDGIFYKRVITNLRMLSPTAQALYASAHAMLQHGGRNISLRWLYDLDQLVCLYRERLDWTLLLSRARLFEWGSAVSAALSQVIDYFNTPVPQDVLANLSTQTDRNTERVAALQVRPATHTLEEYQKLKSLKGYARLRLLLALVAPGPAYMRWRYGLKSYWTLPAWYLHRWWGIFKDAGKTAWLLIQKAALQAHHPKGS